MSPLPSSWLHMRSTPPAVWSSPPSRPSLSPGGVDLWLAPLDLPAETLRDFLETLDPDERARAARFHFDRHRHPFIASHGLLRRILSLYLSVPPAELRFSEGPWGKPSLAGEWSSSLRFNMSHSGSLALYGVSLDRELGVDVEQERDNIEFGRLASRFFAPAEAASVLSLPERDRRRAFFRCWSRKEAYIKATGRGVSLPLDGFEVTVAESAEILSTQYDPPQKTKWSLRDVPVPSGYAAALAAESPVAVVRCFLTPLA